MRYLVVFIVLIFLASGAVAIWQKHRMDQEMGGAPEVVASGEALIGGPFLLTDQHGKTVEDTDFRGRYMLVFFGFTHCPDICPVGLLTMTRAMERLGKDAKKVAPIFITVDPERDTPEQMGNYVSSFYPTTVALSGSVDAVTQAAKGYRVYFSKMDPMPDGNYMVNHSGYIYLMGPDGKYIRHFPHNAPDQDLAAALEAEFKRQAQ